MRLLIDTNILLWASSGSERLDEQTTALLESKAHTVLFSPVSIWEIAIKAGLKRPTFDVDPAAVLDDARNAGFEEVLLTSNVAMGVTQLPPFHADPFDRLLIAQAMAEPAQFVTTDRILAQYSELVTVVRRAS